MVNLPPVLIPSRDVPNECGFVLELQELDRLMTGGSGVHVQGKERRGGEPVLMVRDSETASRAASCWTGSP